MTATTKKSSNFALNGAKIIFMSWVITQNLFLVISQFLCIPNMFCGVSISD